MLVLNEDLHSNEVVVITNNLMTGYMGEREYVISKHCISSVFSVEIRLSSQ